MAEEPDRRAEFDRLAKSETPGIVSEFLGFLKESTKWWLLPVLIIIAVIGVLIALAQTGAAPFIYTLF
jgi:hypothetical protein